MMKRKFLFAFALIAAMAFMASCSAVAAEPQVVTKAPGQEQALPEDGGEYV